MTKEQKEIDAKIAVLYDKIQASENQEARLTSLICTLQSALIVCLQKRRNREEEIARLESMLKEK